jgi:hypothetical protein
MYKSLYASYDEILYKDGEEKKILLQKRRGLSEEDEGRRKLQLERKKQKLQELPAFYSMIQVLGFPTMIGPSASREYLTLIPAIIDPMVLRYSLVALGSIIMGISVRLQGQ